MAATGTITLYIESVDYNGGGTYTRGAKYSNLNARWNVNDNGYLTLTEESYSTDDGYWWICSSLPTDINRYFVSWSVQFQPDGESWQTLYSAKVAVKGPCPDLDYTTGTNVKAMMETFCNNFPGVQLTKSGMLRVVCGANLAPAPDSGFPYAFPNDVYSEASQVPVHIDVSWDATLNYDANGGSGAPSGETHRQSADSYAFTVSNTIPTWEWHRFDGWATSSTATTPQYHGGDTITIHKNDPTVTLYAVWTEYYRCGDVRYSGVFKTTHRSGGKCHIRQNGNWVEMRSIDAGTVTNDPPQRYYGGAWHNQYKIGSP